MLLAGTEADRHNPIMYPHTIRLRGPWECRALDPAGPVVQITVPARLDKALTGVARMELLRRFNWVASIGSDERVWLYLDRCRGEAEVRLNGVPLGSHAATWDRFRFDVTRVLQQRNELQIILEYCEPASRPNISADANSQPFGILGGVYLEIESRTLAIETVWISALWCLHGGSLCLHANVAGSADRKRIVPSLLLDNTPIHVMRNADESDTAIQMTAEHRDVEAWQGRPNECPALYDVTLRLTVDGSVHASRSWRVGFRPPPDDNCRATERIADWMAGDSYCSHEVLNDADAWRGDSRLDSVDCVQLSGHIGPESLYDFADAAGLSIVQDIPSTDAAELAARLGVHPSIVRWRITADGLGERREQAESVAKILGQLDPTRLTELQT